MQTDAGFAARPLEIFIAMPARGTIAVPTVESLLAVTQEFQAAGVPFAFATYDCADQIISRNHLMSRFLTETRFSHVLWIDSDMAFDPQAVWRLLAFGEDFAACAYAQKAFDWPRLRALIEAEAGSADDEKTPIERLVSRSLLYNHQLSAPGGGRWRPRRRDGFATVPAAGQGLALMSRAVPESMVARGVVEARPNMGRLPGHRGLDWHDFFGHVSTPDGGLMRHCDESFSWRWVAGCGGDIWLDCDTLVGHVGPVLFEGLYADRVEEDFPPE